MAWTCSQLQAEVPDLADHEVRRLLTSAAGRDAAWLIGDPEVPLDAVTRFRDAVRRRRSGEPLQYIEGNVQFGPLQLHLSLIHISEPTRPTRASRMPSSA